MATWLLSKSVNFESSKTAQNVRLEAQGAIVPVLVVEEVSPVPVSVREEVEELPDYGVPKDEVGQFESQMEQEESEPGEEMPELEEQHVGAASGGLPPNRQ